MRIMSIQKVVTAAAIRHLAAAGKLTLDDYVFDLGQEGGGLLDLDPVPSLGDPRTAHITVRHLLVHKSGLGGGDQWVWDHGRPPSLEEEVRGLLGRPLQATPGNVYRYSNDGYLVLGYIVEALSSQDYISYLHEHIFGSLGIGRQDFILGRTFPEERSEREPWYDASRSLLTGNVFDPLGPLVPWPDGGWDQGIGLAASTRALLDELLESGRIVWP